MLRLDFIYQVIRMEILKIEWKEGKMLVSFYAITCLFHKKHKPCAFINVGILPSFVPLTSVSPEA